MTFPLEVLGLDVRHGATTAVEDASFVVAGGSICGLLGRNGAGKSSLLATVAAHRRPSAGAVRVDGEDPYEHPRLMSEICLVGDGTRLEDSTSVREVLEVAADLRPRWDGALADRLVERFELPLAAKLRALSRGTRSALSVVVGLAARAPLTLFDEPHLGMDVPGRYAFYEELVADVAEHPRTVVLATHLIDEVALLLDDVVILDRGRVLVHEPVERLRRRGAELTGPAPAVDAAAAGLRVLGERRLGGVKSVVVFDRVDDDRRASAAAAGVEVGPVPLQDLFVHLISEEARR